MDFLISIEKVSFLRLIDKLIADHIESLYELKDYAMSLNCSEAFIHDPFGVVPLIEGLIKFVNRANFNDEKNVEEWNRRVVEISLRGGGQKSKNNFSSYLVITLTYCNRLRWVIQHGCMDQSTHRMYNCIKWDVRRRLFEAGITEIA